MRKSSHFTGTANNLTTQAPAGRLRVARHFSGGAKWEGSFSAVGTTEVLTHTLWGTSDQVTFFEGDSLQAVRKYRKKEYGFTDAEKLDLCQGMTSVVPQTAT